MMVVYINYGADPVAVLTTCVMACPCSLYLSKLFLPEVSTPETAGTVQTKKEKSPFVNAVDPITAVATTWPASACAPCSWASPPRCSTRRLPESC